MEIKFFIFYFFTTYKLFFMIIYSSVYNKIIKNYTIWGIHESIKKRQERGYF